MSTLTDIIDTPLEQFSNENQLLNNIIDTPLEQFDINQIAPPEQAGQTEATLQNIEKTLPEKEDPIFEYRRFAIKNLPAAAKELVATPEGRKQILSNTLEGIARTAEEIAQTLLTKGGDITVNDFLARQEAEAQFGFGDLTVGQISKEEIKQELDSIHPEGNIKLSEVTPDISKNIRKKFNLPEPNKGIKHLSFIPAFIIEAAALGPGKAEAMAEGFANKLSFILKKPISKEIKKDIELGLIGGVTEALKEFDINEPDIKKLIGRPAKEILSFVVLGRLFGILGKTFNPVLKSMREELLKGGEAISSRTKAFIDNTGSTFSDIIPQKLKEERGSIPIGEGKRLIPLEKEVKVEVLPPSPPKQIPEKILDETTGKPSKFFTNTLTNSGIAKDLRLTKDQFLIEPTTGEIQKYRAGQRILKYGREKEIVRLTERVRDSIDNVEAGALTKYLMDEGRYEEATDLIKSAQVSISQTAATLQSTNKAWLGNSPEGTVKWAAGVFQKAAEETKGKKLLAEKNVKTKITQLKKINEDVINTVAKDADKKIKSIIQKPSIGKPLSPGESPPPEEILTKRIINDLKKPKAKGEDVIRDMINTLFKVAKEKLPPKFTKVNNTIQFIEQAIKNKDEFGRVYFEAKKLVLDRIDDIELRESAEGKLRDFFETKPHKFFPQKMLDSVVKKEIKAKKINMNKLIREHYTKKRAVSQSLEQSIISQTDLNPEQAKELAQFIERKFSKLTKEKKIRAMETMKKSFDKIKDPETRSKFQQRFDRLLADSNLGIFNDERYFALEAKRLNLAYLDPDFAKEIYKRSQAIQKLKPDDPERYALEFELMKDIENAVPPTLRQKISNITNVPRSMMATIDLSPPFKQGIFSMGSPLRFASAFSNMFKYAGSEKAYEGLMKSIRRRPTFRLMHDSGLQVTDLLSKREEEFVSDLVEKIPIFGRLARGSNRAFSGFINKLRADIFDDMVAKAKHLGIDNNNPEYAKQIASYVNAATGRGDLPAFMEKNADILNATFFAPRLMSSRVQLLLNPKFYIGSNKVVRQQHLKNWLAFVSFGMTMIGLAKLAGDDDVEVGVDSRSADFGKIKVKGKTRLDVWGGFQQYAVLGSRLLSNVWVSSTSGKRYSLGEGWRPTTRKDLVIRNLENKLSPLARFLFLDLLGAEKGVDKPPISAKVIEKFIPMIISDAYDIYKQQSTKGLLLAIPGVFGVGSLTYGDPIPYEAKTKTGKSVIKWKQVPDLAEDIVNLPREIKDIITRKAPVKRMSKERIEQLKKERLEKFKRAKEMDEAEREVKKTGKSKIVNGKRIFIDNEGNLRIEKIKHPKKKKRKSVLKGLGGGIGGGL